jgi:hypothetical protein
MTTLPPVVISPAGTVTEEPTERAVPFCASLQATLPPPFVDHAGDDDRRGGCLIRIEQRVQRAEHVAHVVVADRAFLRDEVGGGARDVGYVGAHDEHVGDFDRAEDERQKRRQDERELGRRHAALSGADLAKQLQHPLTPEVKGSLRNESAA